MQVLQLLGWSSRIRDTARGGGRGCTQVTQVVDTIEEGDRVIGQRLGTAGIASCEVKWRS